jgi:NAD+ synthase (glutamine-hydrolysing)
MRLALVQFNPMVGDVGGNARRIVHLARAAAGEGAGLVVFPELALVGYPPRDLLLQEGFLDAVRAEAIGLAAALPAGVMVMVGAPWKPGFHLAAAAHAWDPAGPTTNSVLCFRGGVIEARYDKRLLPTYDVFDEDRYFTPGTRAVVVDVEGVKVGVSICEDLWRGDDARAASRYTDAPDPVSALVQAGATLIVNPSASPFVLGKGARQRDILMRHAKAHGVTVAAVNQVGGNDDLIFDGHAAVYAPATTVSGSPALVAAGPGFAEHTLIVDIPDALNGKANQLVADPLLTATPEQLLWNALVLGVRDYCRKTGFTSAVLGLSGGIDSALVATIAAAALGPERVTGVLMPSRYSSQGSLDDASALARAIKVRAVTVPIEPPHAVMESLLAPAWAELRVAGSPGITEENIQSRLRGVILMAFSNKSGAILLTTGNKSELAVGYCTLYGDMNGGLAVLPDVTKMQVYALSRWINANHRACGFETPPIPEASITKAPSAELRPNQTDQDSLPPYEVLDEIIERYIEEHQSATRIIRETGIDEATVRRVIRLIDVNEYKRKQTPVGLKVTDKSFGPGRRQPIAQGWRADRH